jgi:membrane-associated phospholipid phosphatase
MSSRYYFPGRTIQRFSAGNDFVKSLKKNRKLATKLLNFILAQGIITILYYGVMYVTPYKAVELPITFIDNEIGFHDLFAWIYLSYFFLLLMTITCTEKIDSVKCAKSIVLNALISSIFFFFIPTRIPPDYYSNEEHTRYFLSKLIQNIDANNNCFPSIHIANSLAAAYYFGLHKGFFLKYIVWFWFLLISWSVLSTKQHYFLDIPGGIIVALISLYFIEKYGRYSKSVVHNEDSFDHY